MEITQRINLRAVVDEMDRLLTEVDELRDRRQALEAQNKELWSTLAAEWSGKSYHCTVLSSGQVIRHGYPQRVPISAGANEDQSEPARLTVAELDAAPVGSKVETASFPGGITKWGDGVWRQTAYSFPVTAKLLATFDGATLTYPEPPTEPGAVILVTELSDDYPDNGAREQLPFYANGYEFDGRFTWDTLDGQHNITPELITRWSPARVVPAGREGE